MSEEPKSNLVPILIGIGCVILAVAIIAASVVWGFEKVIQFIGVVIVTAVFGFATRKFWLTIFSSFENFKRTVVISSISALVLYLLFWGRKLMNLALADTTFVSPAIFGVIVVAWSVFFVKLFSADFSHRKLSLSLLVHSSGYMLFADVSFWFEPVAIAAIVSWQWLRFYKKFILKEGMRVAAIGLLLKQSIRLSTMTLGPLVVLYMLVQNLTDWWQMGTVILSYLATIYLCWAWLRRWILDLTQGAFPWA